MRTGAQQQDLLQLWQAMVSSNRAGVGSNDKKEVLEK
jgi:hypothetical protein